MLAQLKGRIRCRSRPRPHSVPDIVDWYMQGKIEIKTDHRLAFEDINKHVELRAKASVAWSSAD
ncbi:hypothetical protein RCCGEPOP_24802 [Rhizobium sp. Pop5]|nr:hypothetical protein RCCGEPOP_24802 [Rhizobium sp. Pop5]